MERQCGKVDYIGMERQCGKVDYRLQKLGTLPAVIRSIILHAEMSATKRWPEYFLQGLYRVATLA